MADISETIKPAKTVVAPDRSGLVTERYLVNSQTGAANIAATGTHTLIKVQKGDFITRIIPIVAVVFAGGTTQLSLAGTTITGAMTAANLDTVGKGNISQMTPSITNTDVNDGFYISADDTLDWIIASSALTAGALLIIIEKYQNIFGANVD